MKLSGPCGLYIGELEAPLACWSQGHLAELMGMISKSIRVRLRCEVVWPMWGTPWPPELTLVLLKARANGWIRGHDFKIH